MPRGHKPGTVSGFAFGKVDPRDAGRAGGKAGADRGKGRVRVVRAVKLKGLPPPNYKLLPYSPSIQALRDIVALCRSSGHLRKQQIEALALAGIEGQREGGSVK